VTDLRETAEQAAAELRAAFADWADPIAMLQVGTGFDPIGLFDECLGSVPLGALSGMPAGPGATGAPELRLGTCGARQVLLAYGRHYLYESADIGPAVLPACAALLAGIRNFVFLGPCESLREDFKPGTWVALTDYVNNTGRSPLVGNPGLARDAFPDMRMAFCQQLIAGIVNSAAEVGVTPRLGVFQANLGPEQPTPAEAEVARNNGADVTGFALVPETIAAHAMGGAAAALALVTNFAPSYWAKPTSHEDTQKECRFASPPMMRALRDFLADADMPDTGS
jgi:purine-nucleoside phosphorylase